MCRYLLPLHRRRDFGSDIYHLQKSKLNILTEWREQVSGLTWNSFIDLRSSTTCLPPEIVTIDHTLQELSDSFFWWFEQNGRHLVGTVAIDLSVRSSVSVCRSQCLERSAKTNPVGVNFPLVISEVMGEVLFPSHFDLDLAFNTISAVRFGKNYRQTERSEIDSAIDVVIHSGHDSPLKSHHNSISTCA